MAAPKAAVAAVRAAVSARNRMATAAVLVPTKSPWRMTARAMTQVANTLLAVLPIVNFIRIFLVQGCSTRRSGVANGSPGSVQNFSHLRFGLSGARRWLRW